MFFAFCFLYYLLVFSKQESFAKSKLNDFVAHYETLNYGTKQSVYRREVDANKRTHFLEFDAHGRKFQLSLRPDTKTIAQDAEITDGNGKGINFKRDSLLIGEVVGEPGSIVHGVLLEDGSFTGKIHTKDGIYFIERAKRYFKNPSFHSVIYKDEDVKFDFKFAQPKIAPMAMQDEFKDLHVEDESLDRARRSTGDKENNVCRLSMEADYTFLEMATDAILAVGEMLTHVQALNIIYGRTFNTSATYAPYSLQFHVGRLRVHNETETPVGLQRDNIDASTFLTIMSRTDYSKFCQAVYFTHRDFAGGILGLAWIGHPSLSRPGGMCDRRRGGNSYNTAVVTFTLQGRNNPPKVSEITFAHEIGHAFGATHDESECTPGGEEGNYIMFDKATSGDRNRNDRFSPCSIRQIVANVNAKRGRVLQYLSPLNRLCLESYARMIKRGDLCGNGVIEGSEECDCGNKDQCEELETGSCCDWNTCKLRIGKQCSPSQGPCCTKECTVADEKTVCRQGNDCLERTKCLSLSERTRKAITSYKCPDPQYKPNGTECNGGALLCHNGLCAASVCTKFGLKPCECKAQKHECHACCIKRGVCEVILKKEPTYSVPYNYTVGAPCANNTGYCDFFQYCQRVDLDGPLLQLFKLYFTAEGVRELTRKYWWAILLGTLGLIAIVVLLVIYGAKYTGTDSPDGKPAEPLPSFCCCFREDSGVAPRGRRQLMEEQVDVQHEQQDREL